MNHLPICGALLAVFFAASPAQADGEIDKIMSAADKARLQQFDTVRKDAIADAKTKGDPADVKILDGILSGGMLPFSGDFNAEGGWRCRTIKLGGDPALVIYGWFKCRISDDGAGWKLEKLTGSQRTTGRLYTENDTRLIYIGAGHYGYEQPRSYGSSAEQDQVAYVLRPGQNRLRFEFPLPQFESKFDILELER
jgi:hypothetical protein